MQPSCYSTDDGPAAAAFSKQLTCLDKFYQMFVYRVSIVSRKNLTNRQITVPHGGLPSMFFTNSFLPTPPTQGRDNITRMYLGI